MPAPETPFQIRTVARTDGEADGWSFDDDGEDPSDFSPPAVDPGTATSKYAQDEIFWDAREDALSAGFSSFFWIDDATTPETPMKNCGKSITTPLKQPLDNPVAATTTPMKRKAPSPTASSSPDNGPNEHKFKTMSSVPLSPGDDCDDDDSGILAGEDENAADDQDTEIELNRTYDDSDSCSESSSIDSIDYSAVFDASIQARLACEVKYSGLGMASLVCYCIAHLTIYELINITCVELGDTIFYNHSELFYATLLMTAFVLLRLTGFIWNYLGHRRSKARQQFLMRLEHGCWDARVTQWFKEHETVKSLVEITAFYLAYLALNNYWYKFLLAAVDQRESFHSQLPSVRHRLKLQNAGECSISDSDDGASDEIDWAVMDDKFLYQRLAKASYYHYNGADDQAALVSLPIAIMASSMGLAFSVIGLSKFGFAFVDNW